MKAKVLTDFQICVGVPFMLLRVRAEYCGGALVFLWGGAMRRGGFGFYFLGVFCWCWRGNCLFWGGDWALGYTSMGFWHYSDLSQFPRILSVKSFSNS